MRRRHRKNPLPILFIIVITIVISLVIYIDRELFPIAKEYCINEIEFIALDAVNKAVTQDMVENPDIYVNIAQIMSNDNKVTSVSTDTYKINKIKTTIMDKSDTIINNMMVDEVSLPIGALYKNIFFFGSGFDIPVRMIPQSTVNVDFASSFESIGINQSLHKIIMVCSVDLKIIMPYETVDFVITHDIAIAETLILGDVPESYTNISDLSSETLEKFYQFNPF